MGGRKMQYKLLHSSNGQRTYAVIMRTGDEVMASMKEFVARESVHAAQFTAIGGLSDVTLMYYDWDKKEYLPNPVHDQVEVASLIGDVAQDTRKASRPCTSISPSACATAAPWPGISAAASYGP